MSAAGISPCRWPRWRPCATSRSRSWTTGPASPTGNASRSAQRTLAAPLRETVRDMPMDHDTFIVLVTRGHSHDVECLLEVLDRPVAYIGMIGSQRRVDAVFELLASEEGDRSGQVRSRLCAYRHRHRRAHPGRDRRLHHGRGDQRPARRPGGLDLRQKAGAGPAETGRMSESANQRINESANRRIGESANRPANQRIGESMNQGISYWASWGMPRTTSRAGRTRRHLSGRSEFQPIGIHARLHACTRSGKWQAEKCCAPSTRPSGGISAEQRASA